MKQRFLFFGLAVLFGVLPTFGQLTQSNPLLFINGANHSDYTKTQLAFGWDGDQEYSHRIGTRHHSGNNIQNAFDFYVWQTGQTKTSLGNKHVMTLTYRGLGIGTYNPSASIHLYKSSSTISPNIKLSMIGSDPGGSFNEIWEIKMERDYALYSNDIVFFWGKEGNTFYKMAQITKNKEVRAGRFQDIDDIDYYLDPAYGYISLKVKGKIVTESKIEAEEIEVKDIACNNIHTDELKTNSLNVKVENVADFVFEKDYPLLSVNEVERYVNEHQHLPDIPSANELEENGMDVAQMNNLLLMKVEELTLYIIEMKKEIEVLKKEANLQ